MLARNLKAMENLNISNSICIPVDVTNADTLKLAVAKCEDIHGPTDCFINCAGTAKTGDFLEQTHEDHANMIAINIQGVVNGIEAALPGMRKRRKGTIINISSIADRSIRPNFAIYAATKAGVKSLTDSLRVANAKYGIRICNLAPAKTITPLLISAKINLDNSLEAIDIANAALWIYQQPQSICIRDIVIAHTNYEE